MSDCPLAISLSATDALVTVNWSDGTRSGYASLWLRDNQPVDRDPHSGQRLSDVADLPRAPRICSVRQDGDALVVQWQDGKAQTSYSLRWLYRHGLAPALQRPELRSRRWLEGAELDGRREFQWATLAAFEAGDGHRAQWLTRLIEDGIAFLADVPRADGAILEAVRGMGTVAQTNYGLIFDVRSVARPENLAYTDYGLGLHTDNPYRDPVPGFQVLHVLLSSPDGGESLFADGFALAEHLRVTDPDAFARLTQTPVPFHYQSADAELYSEKPLIELDVAGRVRAVHYNSRSIAPLRLAAAEIEPFYEAYRGFAGLLREPRFQVRMKLGDGELVAFDNRRTLHGRTAFASACHPRHLQGCYLTRDSVLSRAGVLGRKLR